MSGTTGNENLKQWVDHWAGVLQPADIYWCDGSAEEYEQLCGQLVASGTFTTPRPGQAAQQLLGPLRSGRRGPCRGPHVHLLHLRARRRPEQQLARSPTRCGPTMLELYTGAMQGRTMYVVPFSMGPLGSDIAHIGVQLTDSAYVAVSMRIMTRMGQKALDVLGADRRVRALRPLGRRPARRRRAGRRRGRATRTTSTSCTSRRPARSSRSGRATAATPCSARSASPCASPR